MLAACGFELEIRNQPSQIQQVQIQMRLELMVWRMLPPQFEKCIHAGKEQPCINKKMARLMADLKDFLGPLDNASPIRAGNRLVADQIADVVPAFFRRVLENVPLRRVTELIVYGCLAKAFTEQEILMHTVTRHQKSLINTF
jgi:hypothetical protein